MGKLKDRVHRRSAATLRQLEAQLIIAAENDELVRAEKLDMEKSAVAKAKAPKEVTRVGEEWELDK